MEEERQKVCKLEEESRKMFFFVADFIQLTQKKHVASTNTNIIEGLGNFQIGGKVIRIAKYASDLLLLTTKKYVLQSMIDRLTEIGRYGMEMNVEKTKVIRISRQEFQLKIGE
jgi:hypothetical protein